MGNLKKQHLNGQFKNIISMGNLKKHLNGQFKKHHLNGQFKKTTFKWAI